MKKRADFRDKVRALSTTNTPTVRKAMRASAENFFIDETSWTGRKRE